MKCFLPTALCNVLVLDITILFDYSNYFERMIKLLDFAGNVLTEIHVFSNVHLQEKH